MKSAHCRPMGMLRHGITEAVAPPDLGTDGKLIKRLLEQDHKQEDSIVKKKSSPLVSDCFKKVPVVKLKKLKPGRQKRKQNIVKPECGQHSKQGRQDLNDDGKLIKPHITHDSLPPPNKMPLWRKRHLEQDHKQEDSIVKKKSSPLVSDCFMKVPVVKLKKLKLKSGRQNRKRTIVKPERGQHSKQGRQEQKAADGSIDGKLPPSPFAHNELLASDISITNNPHHLQDTKENKVYMSPPKEYSKIPVDQQFFLNIQTKSQEEESAPTHESHRDQHHTQEQVPSPSNIEAHDGVAMSPLAQNEILPPNTDFPRKGDQENIDCASLETICLKQPVVCLMRLNMETKNQWRIFHEIDNEHLQDDVQCIQPEKHKEPCTDDSDSDKFDKQVTSPRNSEAHDGVAPSPLTQNSILPPSTDFLKQLDQQEGDPLNKSCVSLETTCLKQPVVRLKRVNIETKNQWRIIHQSDSEQQPEKQEELCTDDSERDDFDEQVTSPSNSEAHDSVAKSALAQNAILPPNTEFLRQLVDPSLEKVRLKQPVVRLIRLNRETKNQWRSTDEGNSEQHRDNVQCMQHEEQIEQSMDESDSDDFDEQDLKTLSVYELERLKNIRENAKFLKSLKLLKVPSTLCRLPKRRHCVIRAKKKSRGVTRQSVRLQERKLSIIPEEEPVVLKPKPLQFHGPIKMCPANDVNDGAWRSFQETWKSISTVKCVKTSSVKCRKLTSYANKLQSLTLEEKSVAQNVLGSISSLAIHPSKTRTLVAAGDCNGNVGLWDLKHRSAGIYVFPVHSRKTKAVAFSPSDPQHLLSLGFEGTIRCGDVSYSVFDEIYRGEGYASSFDFLSVDGSVLLVSHYDSKLSVVDRRTRNTKASVHGCLDLKCVRSVSVHPLQRDVCVVAGSGGILIYDVRKLRTDTTQPVMSLLGHRNGAVSASFSPATGNCILTSSAGPCLRVFRTECFGKNLNPVKTFRLNKNKHVEHLMPLTWDPKQENCFVHGLMGGGHISILHVKGQHVHTLSSPYLSAKPNALAVHPTRHVVVAGTRTGMLCLWKKWKNQSDPPEENKCLE